MEPALALASCQPYNQNAGNIKTCIRVWRPLYRNGVCFSFILYLVLEKPIVTCESDQQSRTETDSGGHANVLRKI